MKVWWATFLAGMLLVTLAIVTYYAPGHGTQGRQGLRDPAELQRMANPGKLSKPHAFLDHDCSACHTATKGAEAVNCVVCHANNESILQRQPTAFHADVKSCAECHREHQGRDSNLSVMDHGALAKLGMRQAESMAIEDEELSALVSYLKKKGEQPQIRRAGPLSNPHLSSLETTLDCATCHQNEDRHFGLFGADCSSCHKSSTWNLPEFRHPSPQSMDCAQCHQAPPSHYMMHFNMISAKVAGKPHARVDQCFVCHQTTSWIDIKRVGVYKHH